MRRCSLDEYRNSLFRNAAALLASIVLVILGLFALFGGVLRPVQKVSATVQALANGDATVMVPVDDYRNEFGVIVQAVQVFKDNLIRTRQLETETTEARLAAEAERRAGMRQMAETLRAGCRRHHRSGLDLGVGTPGDSADDDRHGAETASQSMTVAAAAEQAARNVNTVAAAAEELGASVQEIGRQVDGSAELARGRGRRGRPDRRARPGS